MRSRRRCCLCFGLNRDMAEKRGQIAHLDRDPSNDSLDNLAYLCFDHHDQYDSHTSQGKGLTMGEVKQYRQRLYEALETAAPMPGPEGAGPRGSTSVLARILQVGSPVIRLFRGDRASDVVQLGRGRIEVTDQDFPGQEGDTWE